MCVYICVCVCAFVCERTRACACVCECACTCVCAVPVSRIDSITVYCCPHLFPFPSPFLSPSLYRFRIANRLSVLKVFERVFVNLNDVM